jgi:hypothetical protein
MLIEVTTYWFRPGLSPSGLFGIFGGLNLEFGGLSLPCLRHCYTLKRDALHYTCASRKLTTHVAEEY